MAGINIKNIPNAASLSTEDYVIVEQATGTKKTSINDLTKTGTVVHYSENPDAIVLQRPDMIEKIDNIETNITKVSSQLEQKANKVDVARISSGTPLFANSITEMTDTTRNHVNTTDGYLYIYSDGSWTKTIIYQSTGINDKSITARKLNDVIHDCSSNKVDTSKLSDGYLTSSGLNGGNSYKTTDYIKVEKGDTIRFYKDSGLGTNAILRLYNVNKEQIQGLDGELDPTSTYKTAIINIENVAYVRFSFQAKNVGVVMLTINEDYPSTFETFYDNGYKFIENYKLNNTQKEEVSKIISNSSIQVENPLTGKIITFNGDSICFGDGFKGGYGKIIAEKYNMTYENKGVSGGTITYGTTVQSTGSNRHWICNTIQNMREDADYIILEGGVNDASLGVSLGEVSVGYTATLDNTTFCGAFESMLKQAIDRFPGKKIGFIITHKMSNSFANFYPKIIEICEKWGIPYCDLYKNCPPLNYIPYLKANYTKNGDGWHPNELGYKAYYVPKIETFIKSL